LSTERQRFTGVDAPASDGIERPPRRTTVVAGIIAACVLFLGITGFLFYRAMVHPETSHVVVILASEPWVGAELVVSGGSLKSDYKASVDRTGRFSVPFYLGPGDYRLVVRMNGAPVYEHPFRIGSAPVLYVSLAPQGPTTQPAAP
jgi:hypothetical protein